MPFGKHICNDLLTYAFFIRLAMPSKIHKEIALFCKANKI
jgi:hypothetical protein